MTENEKVTLMSVVEELQKHQKLQKKLSERERRARRLVCQQLELFSNQLDKLKEELKDELLEELAAASRSGARRTAAQRAEPGGGPT